MKFLNPNALLNQPILCAIHHHNWTQEALEDHFLQILKYDMLAKGNLHKTKYHPTNLETSIPSSLNF